MLKATMLHCSSQDEREAVSQEEECAYCSAMIDNQSDDSQVRDESMMNTWGISSSAYLEDH